MAYTARTRTDDGGIPLSAANLNTMEKGIEEAVNIVKIGECEVNGDTSVNLGYKARYLTAMASDGTEAFTMFQNTASEVCELTEDGFTLLGEKNITDSNLSEYFDETNGEKYYFAYNTATNRFVSNNNNKGANGTHAVTKLTAKDDIKIKFTYGCDSEPADKIYIEIINQDGESDTKIETGVGGKNIEKSYSGIIRKGQTIVFTYKKDSSIDNYSDIGYFKDIKRIGLKSGQWSYMAIK